MAGSTIEMKCAAWWQVGLSFAAVILVGMTARYAYRAAVAAEKINFITQDSAERQLRAYLSATPHFQGRDVTRQPPSYTIAIKNHGNTPAYDVAVWLDGVLNAYPSNEEWFTQGEPTGPIRVINPGEEQHSNGFFEKVLDAETAREIMAGTARFYFWGEITYRDAFATERRFLRFRYMFGGPSARLGKVDVCENGNEAN